MLKRLQTLVLLFALWAAFGSWGFLVHRTVNQLAVYQLPEALRPFFYRNLEYLVYNAPRPDIRRNQDSTEATRHFIDLEMFGKDAAHNMPMDWPSAAKKYSRDTLEKYGYVPYHVVYMKQRLTEAFRKGDKDSILFYAADLGHYIGDAHVPLHTTVNYDGQLSNQKGLHSLWESTVPELDINTYDLSTKHQAKYLANPSLAIWTAVRAAALQVPVLLQKETEVSKAFTDEQKYRIRTNRGRETKSYSTEFARAYGKEIQSMVNRQLISSAELIADFWYTAWVDAGKPNLSTLTPNWTPDDAAKLAADTEAFRQNGLIKGKKLVAKGI